MLFWALGGFAWRVGAVHMAGARVQTCMTVMRVLLRAYKGGSADWLGPGRLGERRGGPLDPGLSIKACPDANRLTCSPPTSLFLLTPHLPPSIKSHHNGLVQPRRRGRGKLLPSPTHLSQLDRLRLSATPTSRSRTLPTSPRSVSSQRRKKRGQTRQPKQASTREPDHTLPYPPVPTARIH